MALLSTRLSAKPWVALNPANKGSHDPVWRRTAWNPRKNPTQWTNMPVLSKASPVVNTILSILSFWHGIKGIYRAQGIPWSFPQSQPGERIGDHSIAKFPVFAKIGYWHSLLFNWCACRPEVSETSKNDRAGRHSLSIRCLATYAERYCQIFINEYKI